MVLTTLSLTFGLVLSTAFAQNPDMKVVKFTGEIASKAPYTVKFKAPAGHHFNEEGPTKVEALNDGQATLSKLVKAPQTVTAEFPKEMKLATNCAVKANLFVCDDKNTYCLPVRQEFDCQKLQAKAL